MVQLASLRFPSIDSITEGSSANYTTSLITEMYTGSYPTLHAFYHYSLLDLALQRCLNRPHPPRPGRCCTSSPGVLVPIPEIPGGESKILKRSTRLPVAQKKTSPNIFFFSITRPVVVT